LVVLVVAIHTKKQGKNNCISLPLAGFTHSMGQENKVQLILEWKEFIAMYPLYMLIFNVKKKFLIKLIHSFRIVSGTFTNKKGNIL
jgi:hypothetical protein